MLPPSPLYLSSSFSSTSSTLPRLRAIVSQAFPKIAQLDSREGIAPISKMKRLPLTERVSQLIQICF
jgi:hypothetical protein